MSTNAAVIRLSFFRGLKINPKTSPQPHGKRQGKFMTTPGAPPPEAARVPSDLHLGAELHRFRVGHAEEVRGRARVVVHGREQPLAHHRHAVERERGGPRARRGEGAEEEVADGAGVDGQPVLRHELGDDGGDVGVLLKAVKGLHAPVAPGRLRHLDALALRHLRRLRHRHLADDHHLVDRLVVAQVEHQRGRHAVQVRHGVDGGARGALDGLRREPGQEGRERRELGADRVAEQAGALGPGGHGEEEGHGDGEGEPGAVEELVGARDEQQRVEREHRHHERDQGRGEEPARVADAPEHPHHRDEQRRDHHGHGDGEAVGVGEVGRLGEDARHGEHGGAQDDVGRGHVDPADLGVGGVAHGEAGEVAEGDGLARDGVGARDDGLRRDDGRDGGHDDGEVEELVAEQVVEGVVDLAGVADEEGALPQVVEEERGHGDEQPRQADRERPEVAHVRVQALRPGHAEHDAADDRKEVALRALVEEEADGARGVEGLEDAGLLSDLLDAAHGQHHEPQDDHRPEHPPDEARAEALDGEEQEKDGQGNGHSAIVEVRRGDGYALERGEHRDRRSEDGVGIEHGGAQHSDEEHDNLEPLRRLRIARACSKGG
mmetsp:Transcript_17218/g.47289  ORF Transcript_17218/g.47289 Transcript_17218/m.47289 type:complete len:605 (+) Transcript_17218:163-1977(+)